MLRSTIDAALCKNRSIKVRANAVSALRYPYRGSNAIKALIQALDDENAEVRKNAASSLPSAQLWTVTERDVTERDEASKKLLRLVCDKDVEVKINAIVAYGIIAEGNSTDDELAQLINLLKDDSPSVRYYTAKTLGYLKARNALDALKQMVKDEERAYPWAKAIWAIRQIEPSFIETIQENGWEYLYMFYMLVLHMFAMSVLYDNDVDKRKMGAKVLGAEVWRVRVLGDIGTEIALPFLEKMHENLKNSKNEKAKAISGEELFDVINCISGELFDAIHCIKERMEVSE